MKEHNLKRYLYLDKKFSTILKSNSSNWRTYCISILQFIKPHSEYYVNYEIFFKKKIYQILFYQIKFFFKTILSLIKWSVRFFENLLLQIFLKKTSNFKNKKTDIVFITCLVNSNTVSSRKNVNKDFIFGSIIQHLKKIYNVKVVYINLTKKNSKLVFNQIKNNKEILILDKILSLREEIAILFHQFKELINLFKNFQFKKLSLYEFILVGLNIFSYETKCNFRLRFQLLSLMKKIQPKLSVVSFEGHCWEKLVFDVCKITTKIKSFKNIGYQHGGIIKNQLHILRNYKKNFNPDFILTSGKFNQQYFVNFFTKKKKRLFEIGSNRYLEVNKVKLITKIKNKNKKNFLIIPEGTNYETEILFNFSYELAKIYKNFNFILRTHPQINLEKFLKKNYIFNRYKNLNNLIISKNSFNGDLKRSDYIIYRGSTGVVPAILNGLVPIYLSLPNENINIDPIFKLKKLKLRISNVEQLKFILNKNKNFINDFIFAINFCKKYFTKQETKKTLSIFDKIIRAYKFYNKKITQPIY